MAALALITPTWPTELWTESMRRAAPELDVRAWPALGDLASIAYAAAWLPPLDVLRSLKGLKVIFSLGAGVDAILRDPSLPDGIPIVRVNEPDLTARMAAYVVLHVLMHHRQQRRVDENQRQRIWDSFATHAPDELAIGIMGLGVMGEAAAERLRDLDFKVAGWSRTRKRIAGVHCYAGPAEFDAFLHRTDILVSLLPDTPETRGIVNAGTIAKLSRRGPFGAPAFINAGRGQQQVEADLLAALDSGALHAATLDVFETEPLPVESPLWSHPRVTLTPHLAADSEPIKICNYIARQIRRFEAGEALENVVDRARGY